eukprot:1471201-Rhodomonas_salina.4
MPYEYSATKTITIILVRYKLLYRRSTFVLIFCAEARISPKSCRTIASQICCHVTPGTTPIHVPLGLTLDEILQKRSNSEMGVTKPAPRTNTNTIENPLDRGQIR